MLGMKMNNKRKLIIKACGNSDEPHECNVK